MRKAILLPFEIGLDNNLKYTAAMEMAKQNRLPLICFTTIPPKSSDADLDEVYLHLLLLNGFYQMQNDTSPSAKKVVVKRVIKKGSFEEQLDLFIKNSPLELILFQWEEGEA